MINPYAISAIINLGQKNLDHPVVLKINERSSQASAFKQVLLEHLKSLRIGILADNGGESPLLISNDDELAVTLIYRGTRYDIAKSSENRNEAQTFFYAQEDGGFYEHHNAPGFHSIHITKGDGYPAFVAGVVLGVLAEYSPIEILHVATLFAGVILNQQKLTYSNALTLVKSCNLRYNCELAGNIYQANYIPNTDIEVINQEALQRANGYPIVAIFDLDGTISTLRVGWDEVMRRRMIEFIAGDRLATLSSHQLFELNEQVEQIIEHTTGVQTVVQMEEMYRLLQKYDFVPKDRRKTPAQYKDIYAQEIREHVAERFDRFKRGILNLDDLTMKGAIAFITHLRNKGTTVYLASGTDDKDVKHETNVLGYATLFNGGIYGSVGDLANDPKSLVMRLAKKQVGSDSSFGEVVVFGDGPVEIREAKKAGFLSVGIVSDERQRFGINKAKRERLILAGSDLLMPDYSWSSDLARALGWETQ